MFENILQASLKICEYGRNNQQLKLLIKTPCLFYFRSVKFHHVKETHNINSLLTLLEIVVASQLNEGQRNKSLSRFVDNLKTPTQSDLKVHALRYANELLVRIR